MTSTASISSGTGAVIENSGMFDLQTDADISYNHGGLKTRFENTGILEKTLGTASTDIGAAVNNDGSISIGADSILTTAGNYTQATGSTTLSETTSKLTASGAQVRVQGGTLKGVGTVGSVLDVSGGTVAPGLSTGILKANGSYAQGAGGTLEVEIGGSTPGSGHDQLDVGTTASLDGTLDIVTRTARSRPRATASRSSNAARPIAGPASSTPCGAPTSGRASSTRSATTRRT